MNFAETMRTWGSEVTGVFSESFAPLFSGAQAMRALTKPSKKVMEHPLESGALIADHVIFNPIEIELMTILEPANYQDVYRQIQDAYNSTALLIVQTKAGSFKNMLIEAMPADESPELSNTLAVVLQLREVRIAQSQFQALPPTATRSPKDSSTVKRGERSGKDDAATAGSGSGSVAYGIFF